MSKDRDDYQPDFPEEDSNGNDPADDSNEFGLTRPTGELEKAASDAFRPTGSKPSDSTAHIGPMTPDAIEKAGGKPKVWKGFEEEVEHEHEVAFVREKDTGNEDMDMTPMVDVVFLLLIFFMVTASFTLQKSIEQPPSKSEDPSMNFKEEEDNDEFVQIIIDQYNTYRLTSRNSEEVEAASDNEMRRRLKDMVNSTSAKKLIILHHGDATHEKVVTAWDAGVNNAIQNIVTQLTEVDF